MKNIVYIGGGGGASSIAPALIHAFNVSIVLTTFDDGGSYATFRDEYKNPLTGDIRRVISCLSQTSFAEHLEHRFEIGFLKGHTLGNIFLNALFSQYQDPYSAMERLHELFEVKGKVLGVSYELAELQAQLKDRSIIRGEHKLDSVHEKSHIKIDRVWLEPEPQIADGVEKVIGEADAIILGPGDLYSSTIPPLLVDGVIQAIEVSNAHLIYFCNLFTKYGQTNDYSVSDHVRNLEKYLPRKVDSIVISQSVIPDDIIEYHKNQHELLVQADIEGLEQAGYSVITADLHQELAKKQSSSDKVKRAKVAYKSEVVLGIVKKILGS